MAIDQDNGRLVVTVDAEFLFRMFKELGATSVEILWAETNQTKEGV